MAEFFENKISLHLLEQPETTHRFLYKHEVGNSRNQILKGTNTFPAVEIKNCTGRIIVRCSIYHSNAVGKEFLPHSNELIMKMGSEEINDPHHIIVGSDNGFRAEFNKLIVVITKKMDIVSTLVRKKCQLKREYIARTEGKIRELYIEELEEVKKLAEVESKCIDRDVVCLRFDAFTEKDDILYPVCEPLFSEPIFNSGFISYAFLPFSKMMTKSSRLSFLKSRHQESITGSTEKSDLNILMLSRVTSYAKGNATVILLTMLNIKNFENIKVRFYELNDKGNLVWEDWGSDVDVLFDGIKISLKTPKYRNENIKAPINVLIELVGPMNYTSTKARSFRLLRSFQYTRVFDKRRVNFTVTTNDKLMAITVLEELIKFIGTVHTPQQAVQMLTYLLGRDYPKNALQIVTYINENKSAIFFIKMIVFYKAFNLLESRHENMLTPLHIAVLCCNEPVISSLLLCGAKVSTMDANLNTSLHLATMVNAPIDIIEILLRDKEYEKISDFIDVQNSDGDTVLTILINEKEENLEVIKLLCQKNVNINQIHLKNGFVPARFAVVRKNVDTLKFLLNLENIDPYIEDFMGFSPLTVALSSSCAEIRSVAQNYNMTE